MYIKLLHVSALAVGHHQAIHYVEHKYSHLFREILSYLRACKFR